MEAQNFIVKWKASELIERTAAQQHFIDQCRKLGKPAPAPNSEFIYKHLVIKVGEERGRAT